MIHCMYVCKFPEMKVKKLYTNINHKYIYSYQREMAQKK